MTTQLSIRWRITLWNTGAFALVLVGFGLLVYGLLRRTHYEQLDTRLRSQISRLASAEPTSDRSDQRVRNWLRDLDQQHELFAVVLDHDSDVVQQSAALAATEFAPFQAMPVEQQRFATLRLPGLGHVRQLQTTSSLGDRSYTIILLASLLHIDEEMTEVVKALAITVPVTLFMAAGVAYFLARKALSPVERLRKLTDEISAEHLDRRLPIANSSDELGLLAHTINAMIGRLEASFHEIRRFTADASHELRTPIAVIRSEAEIAVERANTLDEAKERLCSILEECERLTSLTDQLLTLCREDAGMTQLRLDTLIIDTVVSEAVEVMQPLAKANDHTIMVTCADRAAVRGDSEKLRRVFYNLLDNAIKYTPRGRHIHLSQRNTGGEVIVTVRDEGIGISAKDLPHVFDRFYRGDAASPQFPRGAGLGLSIVKSIVTAHGGRVEVESESGNGCAFHIVLPSCSTAVATTT